jgi:cytochrome c peroxidase
MRLKLIVLTAIFAAVTPLSLSFHSRAETATPVFATQLAIVNKALDSFGISIGEKSSIQKLKKNFIAARIAYKRSAVFVDYFFPVFRRSINGPDLQYSEDDNPDEIRDPHGFQVIERMLFSGGDRVDYEALSKEVKALGEIFFSISSREYDFSDELVFDAMRSAVIRLVSLGITGFDSPLALNAVEESRAALEGIAAILSAYGETESLSIARGGINYLSAHHDFNSFDRLFFIRSFADPLFGAITSAAKSSGRLLPAERRPLNNNSTSIFAEDFLDIDFFSPNRRYQLTPERLALGKQLFYDSILSVSRKRSCASCHDPAKAFTDGLPVPTSLMGTTALKRNTPTLLNAAWQTKFFYDSRASTLENQLNSVVHNADEMEGSLKEAIKRIRQHPVYYPQFQKAYSGDPDPVTEYNIANAISNYIRSLTHYDSKFDRYMRKKGDLAASEKKGFNLFAGKAKCATCHYVPLFNGLVPPLFTETESEVIGVPANTQGEPQRDTDEGKFIFTRSTVHKHAFKTPTLRNVALTAPYMHNGAFKSLEEVMDFYNKGGGAGTHTAFENETLPPDKLQLSKKEIKNIISFLKTLTDEPVHR